MRNWLLLFMITLLAAPAMAQDGSGGLSNLPPPAAIYEGQPFAGGVHFSSVNCGQTFDCQAYALPEQLLELANNCAAERLGFPADMMPFFESTGPYENCALPDNYINKDTGSGQTAFWPICCISSAGDQCQFVCHYYTGSGG